MNSFLHKIEVLNKPFYYSGLLFFGLFIILLAISQFDSRQIMGINRWIKPMKFAVSLGIYVFTWAIYAQYLPDKKQVDIFTWVTIAIMWFEMIVIVFQAVRGELSHFNISTRFNALLFQLMGIGISIQTLWAIYIGFQFYKIEVVDMSISYLWAIRIAVIAAGIFAFEGAVMGAKLRHAVGVPDGGAGLPILNWSTVAGDLRAAHFFGIHALQIIPLFAFYVTPENKFITLTFGLIYCIMCAFLFFNALAGKSVF